MTEDQKIGIIIDVDFARKHNPPYQHPIFLSYENPLRIKAILEYFKKINLWEDHRITKLQPKLMNEEILNLAHTKYYIDTVVRLSDFGSGILDEEVFITKDTFSLAKKAVGGTIQALEKVINKEVSQSLALVRPPGHHALREKGSGLCIFNNIANSILYLRKKLGYNKKIAIIDIDDHFGDGLVQYFYDDPNVLYFSVHEFDFLENDIGFINELGEGEGLGKNINFPVPEGITDKEFLVFFNILEPILKEYTPDLIIVAMGFDMYFNDPIGNCFLTTISYNKFAKKILSIAEDLCEGKLAFILEGGYSLIGLPFCVQAVLSSLLKEEYEPPLFEKFLFSSESKMEEVLEIKLKLESLLGNYWNCLK